MQPVPQLIDTHCHLVSERLRENIVDLVTRAREKGVSKIINIAYCPESVKLACEQAAKFDDVYAAVGIQPHDSKSYSATEALLISDIAKSNKKVVAIGEIGLDNYHKDCSLDAQIPCFEHFLAIACELDLPVVVHVRETHREVADRIRAFSKKGLRGVIHCFTGSRPEAREFLDCGMYISFSGIVTFKNADELREVAKYVPSDRILIETDSPYLAPSPNRGKTNEPAWVWHVCENIAYLRNRKFEEIAKATTTNALMLFDRMK